MRKMLGISAVAVLLAVSGTAMADFATMPSVGSGSGASYNDAGTDFTVIGRGINALQTDATNFGAPVSYVALNSSTAPCVGYTQMPNVGGSNVMRGLMVSKATAGAGQYAMKTYSTLHAQIFGYQDANNFYFLVSRGYSVGNPTNENFGDTALTNPYQYDATVNPTGTWKEITATNPSTWYLGVRVNGQTHLIQNLIDGVTSATGKGSTSANFITDAVIDWNPATYTITVSAVTKKYTAGALAETYTLPSTTIVDSINGSHFTAGGAYGASSWNNSSDYTNVRLANLAFTPVPEPATMSLLVLGGLGVLARRRRA